MNILLRDQVIAFLNYFYGEDWQDESQNLPTTRDMRNHLQDISRKIPEREEEFAEFCRNCYIAKFILITLETFKISKGSFDETPVLDHPEITRLIVRRKTLEETISWLEIEISRVPSRRVYPFSTPKELAIARLQESIDQIHSIIHLWDSPLQV
jgi:hypothetical protein